MLRSWCPRAIADIRIVATVVYTAFLYIFVDFVIQVVVSNFASDDVVAE